MKIRIDMLLEQVKLPKVSCDPISPQRQERIKELTMKKIKDQNRRPRTGKLLRVGCAAAAAVVILSATGFAAYELGWLGFDEIFGEEKTLVEDYVMVVDPQVEAADSDVVARERTYTDEERSFLEQGTMRMDKAAELGESGIVATTENYCFTLEEMLACEDVFMAVIKVEALNEEAKPRMQQTYEKGADEFFHILTINISGESGEEREIINGGMGCDIIEINDGVGYYLVYNNGGQFAVGDFIRFEEMFEGILFEVSISKLMDTKVSKEVSAKEFDAISISPLSLELGGYTAAMIETLEVTLKDGTVIAQQIDENGFVFKPFGEYGFLTVSSGVDPESGYGVRTMLFSRLIDLEQVKTVTVNGIPYSME